MEIDSNFHVTIKLTDFIKNISRREYVGIDPETILNLSIFNLINYIDQSFLKQLLDEIMKSGFRIILFDIPAIKFDHWAREEFLVGCLQIYWKSFYTGSYITFYENSIYYPHVRDWDSNINFKSLTTNERNAVKIQIIHYLIEIYHNKISYALLLMAIKKNREVADCYIAQMPLDIIKYIYDLVKN